MDIHSIVYRLIAIAANDESEMASELDECHMNGLYHILVKEIK